MDSEQTQAFGGGAHFLCTVHCSLLAALELQPRFAGRIGQRLDAAVVQVTAAIENHALDALGDGGLGDGLADFPGLGNVAAGLQFECQR